MVGNDPLVNVYDLGSDPSRFALDRIALAAQLMKDLDSRVVKDGESWARARSAFATLLIQWGNAAYLLSSFVGGQHVSRDHKGDKGSRDPIVPVPASKQREALKALNEQVLGDKAFRFSPALLRKLAGERWYHWGNIALPGAGSISRSTSVCSRSRRSCSISACPPIRWGGSRIRNSWPTRRASR